MRDCSGFASGDRLPAQSGSVAPPAPAQHCARPAGPTLAANPVMRVIGYVRVSTDEQASHGVSLAAQAEKVRAYCALYDLELVELIDDPGASAKTLDRPGLARALAALDRGEVEGLVVAKL